MMVLDLFFGEGPKNFDTVVPPVIPAVFNDSVINDPMTLKRSFQSIVARLGS